MPTVSPFQRLLLATGISNVGDGVRVVAMPLMAIRFTDDPRLIAGVVAATRLPWLVFLLPGGALADRFDRLRMRVVLDAFRAVVGLGFVVLVATGHAGLASLYAVTILLSSAEAIVDSSSMALVPSLVDPDDLEHGVGRLQGTEIVAGELAGPVLGGLLFSLALAAPFVVDAASFALSALIALTITGTFRVEQPARPATVGARGAIVDMGRSIREGLAWLWSQPTLRNLALLGALLGTLSFAFVGVLVVFATDDLGLSDSQFGLLMIPSAIGGMAGAWGAPKLRSLPLGVVVGVAVVTTGLADVAISRSSSLVMISVLLVVDAAAILVWNVLIVAFRQRMIPTALLGRVGASFRFLLFLGAPLGALAGGALADVAGARTTILVSGVGTTLSGLVVWVVVSRANVMPAVPRMEPASA
ncbi:MAG: MFS transporter [Ilumatobacteraceae bacterium]